MVRMLWLLHQGLSCNGINTHCFRIGDATVATAAGCSDSVIQIMGRWSSDAFREYLQLSDHTIVDIGNRMVHTSSDALM